MTEADFFALDEVSRDTILSVADAVSSAVGYAADDARRAAVKAHVGGKWKQGRRLPLDLVNAGFDAACL
jgi:hypothetical protein